MNLSSSNTSKFIGSFVILIMYLALGYLLAHLASDELKSGRKWFKALFGLGIISGIYFLIYDQLAISISCFGIALTSLVGFIKR